MVHVIVRRAGVLALLLCCAGTPVFAQTELGTITGTVKDAQGPVLPGVTATAVHTGTNVSMFEVTLLRSSTPSRRIEGSFDIFGRLRRVELSRCPDRAVSVTDDPMKVELENVWLKRY